MPDYNINFDDSLALSDIAFESLKKVKEINKRKEESNKSYLLQELNNPKISISEMYNDPYTNRGFESKMKLDLAVLNELLTNVNDQNVVDLLKEELSTLFSMTKELYEVVGVNPEQFIYDFKDRFTKNSTQYYEEEAKIIVENYLQKNYYSLSSDERSDKYKISVTQNVFDQIIQEIENNNDVTEELINETVQNNYKFKIIEELIKTRVFPVPAQNIIESNLSDENTMYKKFFHTEVLMEMRENFENQCNKISKIIASYI